MPEDTVSNRYVRALLDAVERRGVVRADFLKAAHWDAQRLAILEGRVSWSELGRLADLAIDLSDDPALGLHAVTAFRRDSVDLIAQVLAHAATARDALESLMELYRLMDDRRRIELRETSRDVTVCYERPTGCSPRAARFFSEMTMHGLYALLWSFAPKARLTRVQFEHRAPAYRGEYKRIFRGAERFEQPFTGLVFDRKLMSAARRYHDEELHRVLRELAASRVLQLTRSASCVDRVRDVLARHDAPSAATMASVARALSISPPTLRRRLAAEGTHYDAVANDALAQRARQLLSVERRTIWETALALGYSDASAFHRAFKRWTGTTPSAVRSDTKNAVATAPTGRGRGTRRAGR